MKIGLLSDTHGYLDPKFRSLFSEVDEIWHAGDFGDASVSKELSAFKPLRAVYGNIDGDDVRRLHPGDLFFKCEQLSVFITHIGGYPGNYHPLALKKIREHQPGLFICGHSHILKVIRDQQTGMLHMNPGAAGKYGFHKIRTAIRFEVNADKIKNVEVLELGLRSAIEE